MIKYFFLFTAIVTVFIVQAQTQNFGIASFIPPPGWQRIDTNGTVAFLNSKTTNGQYNFCQIILYPGSNSLVNADINFKSAWNNLVVSPTKSTAKPLINTEKTPDGWTVVTGVATIASQGLKYNCMVTTITGFSKTISVQVNTTGGEYTATIEKFFNDLDLDNNAILTTTGQPNTANTHTQSSVYKSITIDDYDFITPDGWQLLKNKDHLSIQNTGSGCLIKILEPQPSSGDLEKDNKAVFDIMYAGWQYQKTGAQKFILSKGFLPTGLEYFRKEASMSMSGADGNYKLEEGTSVVVKAGNQIVIIAERHNTSMMAHDACYRNYNTVKRFFNSFTVKNVVVPKNNEVASSRIIGAWSQTESGASSEYVFAANGNYALIGAIGSAYTTSDYRFEYLHMKTYAFQGDGTYIINGKQLTLRKRSGHTEQVKCRFATVNHGGTGWTDRLNLLKEDAGGAYEVGYEKKEK